YPDDVVARLQQLSDGNVVLKEQYLDFLKNRRFRQTLLCHEGVPVDRALRSAAVKALFVASSARPTVEHPDIVSPSAAGEFPRPRQLWHVAGPPAGQGSAVVPGAAVAARGRAAGAGAAGAGDPGGAVGRGPRRSR